MQIMGCIQSRMADFDHVSSGSRREQEVEMSTWKYTRRWVVATLTLGWLAAACESADVSHSEVSYDQSPSSADPATGDMSEGSQDSSLDVVVDMRAPALDLSQPVQPDMSVDDGLGQPPELGEISTARAKRLARDAYLYGFPAVLMDVTKEEFVRAGAALNTLFHLTYIPDHNFRAVVRPNVDTLYSTAWLDLSEEPVVLEVPAVDPNERFYMFALIDMWTNAFAAPGTRTNQGTESAYIIVGPDFIGEVPAGLDVISAPTNTVWLIGRTEVLSSSDVGNVLRVQQLYKLRRLSDYENGIDRQDAALDYASLGADPSPSQIVAEMSSGEFYERLIHVMRDNSPPARDEEILDDLAELGLVYTATFDYRDLPEQRIEALEGSRDAALARMSTISDLSDSGGAWGPDTNVPLGAYETAYTIRAVVADIGLGANRNEDARYLNATVSSDDNPLHGTKRYVLHFRPDQIPPVDAFWSLTVYDENGYLTQNAIGRYALGSNSQLAYNPDGSLDLVLQQEPPRVLESNWLPTPSGPFELTMRLYWPRPAALNGDWEPPEVTEVPGWGL